MPELISDAGNALDRDRIQSMLPSVTSRPEVRAAWVALAHSAKFREGTKTAGCWYPVLDGVGNQWRRRWTLASTTPSRNLILCHVRQRSVVMRAENRCSFLDYLRDGKALNIDVAAQVVTGIACGLRAGWGLRHWSAVKPPNARMYEAKDYVCRLLRWRWWRRRDSSTALVFQAGGRCYSACPLPATHSTAYSLVRKIIGKSPVVDIQEYRAGTANP